MTTELTDAERATVERIEAAPDAPESLREVVGRAMWQEWVGPDAPWDVAFPATHRMFRRMADTAIAVMRGEQQ